MKSRRVRGEQMLAEGLDARRVPQIEPEDPEPVSPLGKIAFGGTAAQSRAESAW